MNLNDSLKKLLLAGIGAVGTVVEESEKTLDELAKRGEKALSQGKVLNEQLRHDIKQAIKDNETTEETKTLSAEDVLKVLDQMSAEDREAVLRHLKSEG